MKRNLEYYLTILAIACVIFIAIGYFIFTAPKQKKHQITQTNQISQQDGFDYVWKFSLTDHLGNKFDSEKLKGKPAIVYFGFTYCPDICPASLGKISTVLSTTKKYGIDLNTIFITIDPERDTSEVLKSYLKFFDQDIVGLTGSTKEVADAASIFKVYYAKDPKSDPKEYMVNHSCFIYIIDSEGKMVKLFSLESKPEEVIDFIRLNFKK